MTNLLTNLQESLNFSKEFLDLKLIWYSQTSSTLGIFSLLEAYQSDSRILKKWFSVVNLMYQLLLFCNILYQIFYHAKELLAEKQINNQTFCFNRIKPGICLKFSFQIFNIFHCVNIPSINEIRKKT
ncbi:hypothetical protein BpHYR1_044939 [Brachionus plicatilis]|uniref:Transmembrane protein n=1 Tax=Brachionus plicatilis TaxID=10195 RepID=A0A3M7S0L2_BRAPC|nr:hypothetical protein BpHYR1_044939 [Brachionus plicatilis]